MIAVTKAGRRKVAEADAIKERVQADVLETLPTRQQKALLDALAELVQGRLSEAADCHPALRRREPRA